MEKSYLENNPARQQSMKWYFIHGAEMYEVRQMEV